MSQLFAVIATVTRPDLGLGALSLAGGSRSVPGYEIIAWGPGGVAWRRNVAKNPFVSGEALISAVKDVRMLSLEVMVYGSGMNDLNSRMATLMAAFEQFAYLTTVTVGGAPNGYNCEPADYSVGDNGQWNKFLLAQFMQNVNFTIPCSPIPAVGAV